jgi:transposase
MVQARTRIMNQLQAVALNEGLRCKKRLWREHGRQQLESFRLAPWASRRRGDVLELLDRLNSTIAELSQAIEQEVEKCPEAQRLRTHPGVGPLTALAFVLIIGRAERFGSGKHRELSGTGPSRRIQRQSATAGAYHQTGQFDAALFAGGSGAGHSAQRARVAQPVLPPGDATRTEDCQSSDGSPTGGSSVLDDAPGMGL